MCTLVVNLILSECGGLRNFQLSIMNRRPINFSYDFALGRLHQSFITVDSGNAIQGIYNYILGQCHIEKQMTH